MRIVGIPGGSFDGTVTVKFTAQITAEDDIGTEITASSNFSFYHCRAESIRNDSFSSDVRDLEKSCVFCADFAKGDVEVSFRVFQVQVSSSSFLLSVGEVYYPMLDLHLASRKYFRPSTV